MLRLSDQPHRSRRHSRARSQGRTGLEGRGSLFYYGPNYTVDVLVTRPVMTRKGRDARSRDENKLATLCFITKWYKLPDESSKHHL